MAGINDINIGYAVETVLQRYERLVNAFLGIGIDVFVQSTLYVGERLRHLNPAVEKLNNGLIALGKRKNTQFVDVAGVLCPQGILPQKHSYDDIHLNGIAYDKWRQTIARFIE